MERFSTLPTQDLSFVELDNKIQELSAILDDRSDKLGALDSLMMQDRLKKKMLPSVMPVETKWYSSGFGVRIDPFTGRTHFPRGVDFTATTGTPIVAAARGVVVYSDLPPRIW